MIKGFYVKLKVSLMYRTKFNVQNIKKEKEDCFHHPRTQSGMKKVTIIEKKTIWPTSSYGILNLTKRTAGGARGLNSEDAKLVPIRCQNNKGSCNPL